MKKNFSVVKVNGQLPDPRTVSAEDIIEEIWSAYLDTVTTLLNDLEAAALALETDTDPEENSAAIRRILHSIKGDSGMAGIMDVHDLCHQAETAFEDMPDNKHAADMVLNVKDWIQTAVKHINSGDATVMEMELEPEEKTKLQVLIIDDDVVCRKRIEMMLKDYFDCTIAGDGQDGFEKYKESLENKKPFDLITLDINMPRMNGHETLEAIRKLENDHGIDGLDGIKIVMTTSEGSSNHVFSAFRQGCEAYVTKSGMGEKLLDEIAKLGLLKLVKVQKNYAL